MTTHDGEAKTPSWLLPAVIATAIILVAALVTFALTMRTTGQPNAAAGDSAAQAAAPAVEATGPAAAPADAELPATHGALDPDGPTVEQIGIADARARFDAGTALFIDVRAGSDYATARIPGALTITSAELETRLAALPADAVIIAYGDASRPESGQRGAQIFMQLGYPTVIALDGGFQAWQAAGYPVE